MRKARDPLTAVFHLPLMALLAGVIGCLTAPAPAQEAKSIPAENTLTLHLRTRTETAKGSGRYHTLTKPTGWDARETAVVVCDMWDKHWCPGATARVAEMAPRTNEVLVAARQRGALIIHCPSDTMDFYKGAAGRKLAQAAPKVAPRVPLEGWCALDRSREAPLPIDDADGGCDDKPGKGFKAWSRQIDTLKIEPGDAITDNSEAYYLMQQRGIANVIVMGVHTNMCVLGRPFSIRQMVAQGKNVVLMRDLTDTMYNPARAPFVSHFTGTDLVVEHIEKYWCPTATSADLLGGKPFRFKADTRPHLVIVSAEDEYQTERTLPAFALQHLGKDFRVSLVFADVNNPNWFPGLEVLDEADVALFSVRRRVLSREQMDVVRRFVAAGKPLIGIRTTCHAFALRKGAKLPAGYVEWPEFDRAVLGCNYNMHYQRELKTFVKVAPGAENHPILTGIRTDEFPVPSWLYKVLPLAKDAVPLLMGRAGDQKPHEPVAWTYGRKDGGRVFFTTLGHSDDFKEEAFARLLKNGIYWAARLPIAGK